MKLKLLTFFLCYFPIAYGQYDEPKFGAIATADLSMSKFDKDTTAGALILFDNGNTEFIFNTDLEFQFNFSRHCMVKIFKKSAFPVGDVSIRLYRSGSSKEDLRGLKAVTYNLVNGKIVKTKLDNDNIYKADGKNYTDVKFALPEIKEGSIIEFSYSIISDYLYNLRGWSFQYSFPARWSQYKYIIPEYFNYREVSKGYLPFDVLKKTNGITTFTFTNASDQSWDGSGAADPHSSKMLKPKTAISVLALKDVPAFISEPNIDCEENYIQSIEFELMSIQYPNQPRKEYVQSWESVNNQMNSDEDFGMLLKNNGFLKDTLTAICKSKSTDIEKASGIYYYVQKRMKWNGENKLWATKGLKKPFLEAVGTSSEINLLLTTMLQAAGLKANPVLFSTRTNGIAIANYPTITNFNSVLAEVEIDGKQILLDATSKYCPFGVLPAVDLNGEGRIINNLSGDWIKLNTSEKYKENKNYTLEISQDGKLTGLITGTYDGYAGIYYRNSLSKEKNNDDYFRKQQENLKGLTISKYSVANTFNHFKPLYDTLSVEVTDHAELIGDKILINPLLFETLEKNRYTLEDRKYPVNYNYPISEAYTFDYTLPKGYTIESLPKTLNLKLPDNSITISYIVQNSDNKIHIEYKQDVNKILFLPNEYKGLKDLYDQVVKINAQQVILKKSI